MRYHKTLLAAGVLLSFITFTAEATLTSGTADGKSVVYSSVSNITWTGDANLLGTLQSTLGYSTAVAAIIAASPTITDSLGSHTVISGDFSSSQLGRATWWGAQAFAGYLNNIDYAGSNQWALPSAGAYPQFGYNTGGQFGQLFYDELGGTAYNPIPDTAYFTNEQAYLYWLGTESAPLPDTAWSFGTNNGYQHPNDDKGAPWYAWAVSPGNVAAVPEPGVFWLLGTGLAGWLGLKRRGNIG
jgi:hypothetical protein